MNTLNPGPSKLAVSIGAATSPPSSSTGGVSGSAPFGDWLVVGRAAIDQKRAVAMESATLHGLSISLDTGHVAALELIDGEDAQNAIADLIAGKDISAKVKTVSIRNP